LRSEEMQIWIWPRAVSGSSPSHTASISLSMVTMWFAAISSITRTVRWRADFNATGRPSTVASSEPSSRNASSAIPRPVCSG
jgi:hypothetical protein